MLCHKDLQHKLQLNSISRIMFTVHGSWQWNGVNHIFFMQINNLLGSPSGIKIYVCILLGSTYSLAHITTMLKSTESWIRYLLLMKRTLIMYVFFLHRVRGGTWRKQTNKSHDINKLINDMRKLCKLCKLGLAVYLHDVFINKNCK